MALSITITDAGRAEIINAQNTGTGPVTITEIGFGTGQYTPSKTQTALQAQIKRVSSIAGQAVANDTIHVMAKDESTNAYNVGEFGLFSDKGTLIAVFSQPAPSGWIIQKAGASTLLLATDIILESLNATNLVFGDIFFINPPATETTAGVVMLENTLASTSTARALTAAQGKKLQDEKEAKIAAGAAAQYWRGDKTWRDFASDVRATLLTGLSTATAAAAAATDTVLVALGKLQAQITGLSNSKLDVNGNAASATRLQSTRTIGGVPFDGTADINLPGVNTAGNQSTSGNAASATKLQTARTIGGVTFDGTVSINLPGVNTAGNQSTTGNAATATRLATARTINGVPFDGTANITVEDSSKLPLSGGRVTGNLTIDTGIDGGYGAGNGGSSDWGACIWGMGPAYDGAGANATYAPTGHYGLSWLRGAHANADAQVAEGAYIFQGGVFKGGIGTAGIKTTGVFYGSGSGITSLNASNLSTGTIPDARLTGTYTGVNITGNAATATKLQTSRTIGGVPFDGSANISLPGVNTAGNQSTSGNAATATRLATARTINGIPFDGSANITVPVPANTASLGVPGWSRDEDTGLITQWGRLAASSSAGAATFPVQFPTTDDPIVLLTYAGGVNDDTRSLDVISTSRSGFSARNYGGASTTVNYIAYGY